MGKEVGDLAPNRTSAVWLFSRKLRTYFVTSQLVGKSTLVQIANHVSGPLDCRFQSQHTSGHSPVTRNAMPIFCVHF